MKKFIVVLVMLFGTLISGVGRREQRVLKLIAPYQEAIDFIISLDPSHKVNDHDVFMFFNKNGLYQKKDMRKLQTTLNIVTRLAHSKKLSYESYQNLESLMNHLQCVQAFAINYASTYYALITYYEIAARYYYIDQENPALVAVIMQQYEQLGLPKMQGRGLYKFVKKIKLDLRRLTALFSQNIVSDDLIVKMNQIKTKLIMLQSNIVVSVEYKAQLSKTRWLKAFGVLVVPFVVMVPFVCFPMLFCQYPTMEYVLKNYVIGYAAAYVFGSFIITIDELRESNKYNIPVHSTSLFSLFRPTFFPFTWIERS